MHCVGTHVAFQTAAQATPRTGSDVDDCCIVARPGRERGARRLWSQVRRPGVSDSTPPDARRAMICEQCFCAPNQQNGVFCMKSPILADYSVSVASSYVTVIFKPSDNEIVFPIVADGSLGPPNVRHAKTGDTEEYFEREVLEMAQRVAMNAIKRP